MNFIPYIILYVYARIKRWMIPWDLAEINEVKLRLLADLEKKIVEFLFHKFQGERERLEI